MEKELSTVTKPGWNLKKIITGQWELLLLVLPVILYYILFQYIPMYGLVISFKDFQPGSTILGSKWVGFTWFQEFFASPYFWRSLKNTVIISIYSIVFFFPLPIIFALVLNEIKSNTFKRLTQTISYMPYFISTVVVVGILNNFLSINTGFVNILLKNLGMEPYNFMASIGWFRPLYIFTDIWQGLGWNAIIYIAALSGIDTEQYEAAKIDGASRLKQIWHISLPGILPTVIILLILRVGSVLNVGFEKIILMYSPANYQVSDVISTYVYRSGILQMRFSYATAVGFFNSAINFVVLVLFNRLSRKVSEVSLW